MLNPSSKPKHKGALLGQFLILFSTIGIQLLQVPLIVGVLGVTGFAQYIILASVPAGFSILDFGLLGAAATSLIRAFESRQNKIARETIQFVYSLIFAIALTVVTITFIMLFVLRDWLSSFTVSNSGSVFVILCLYAVCLIITSGWETVMRGGGYYVFAWGFIGVARLGDFLVFGSMLMLTENLETGTLSMLAFRVISVIFMCIKVVRVIPESRVLPSIRSFAVSKHLLRSSTGSIFQPLGNWILSQGVVLAVGGWAGPTFVAAYSTLRTLSNSVRQLTMVFANSFLPSLTGRQVTDKVNDVERYFRREVVKSLTVAGLASLTLGFFGLSAFHAWSGNLILADQMTMTLFSLSVFFESCFLVLATWMISQNKHFRLMLWYVLCCALITVAAMLNAKVTPGFVAMETIIMFAFLALVSLMEIRTDLKVQGQVKRSSQ